MNTYNSQIHESNTRYVYLVETLRTLDDPEGEEEIEKYDQLLSLALTGGDYNWI